MELQIILYELYVKKIENIYGHIFFNNFLKKCRLAFFSHMGRGGAQTKGKDLFSSRKCFLGRSSTKKATVPGFFHDISFTFYRSMTSFEWYFIHTSRSKVIDLFLLIMFLSKNTMFCLFFIFHLILKIYKTQTITHQGSIYRGCLQQRINCD